MSPDEQKAYCELATIYGHLTDPKYAPHPERAERQLQEAVRKCWRYKAHFPVWVAGYIRRWAQEKDVRGTERPADKDDDPGTVGNDDSR